MERLTLSRSLITAHWMALVSRRDMAMLRESDTVNFGNPSCESSAVFSSKCLVFIMGCSSNMLSEAEEDEI